MEPISADMRKAVNRALMAMSRAMANGPQVDAELVRLWSGVLTAAGIEPGEVERAAGEVLATRELFPAPAAFIAICRPPEQEEALAELAWQGVLLLVRQYGRYASLHVSDAAGDGTLLWVLSRMGWERLCLELTEENRAIWRAEFIRLYRAGRLVRATCEYLAGQMERENVLQGRDLTPALVGRPERRELPQRGRAVALPAGSERVGRSLTAVLDPDGEGEGYE